jgi:hypothetical protein
LIKVLIKFFTYTVMVCLMPACAELKEAGRSIGHMTRNVTTDIGHGSRKTVKVIGRGTKRVVKSFVKDPG